MGNLLTDGDSLERATEFAYDIRDFRKAQRLYEVLVGMRLSDAKRELVYNRLSRRIRATGSRNFRVYLERVESDDEEAEAFVNALTTNLTAFFREPAHFDALASLAAEHTAERRFRVWCAACSTGEEAYSLAITLFEAFGSDHRFSLLASDIDTNVLAHAQQGIYEASRASSIAPKLLSKYAERGKGSNDGRIRMKAHLRSSITFSRINLLDERWPLNQPFDVIFCRNVLIYFERAAQRAVLSHFVPFLTPTGRLVTGHSESLFYASDLFHLEGRTMYRAVHH